MGRDRIIISGCSLITASLVYEVAVSSRARDDKDSRGASANPVVRFVIIYGRSSICGYVPVTGDCCIGRGPTTLIRRRCGFESRRPFQYKRLRGT